MIIKSGVHFSGRELKHWERILHKWCLLVEKSHSVTKGHFASYKFKERPNIGILSAAAWQNNWIAIEEVGLIKQPKEGNKDYKGRTDLILWHGKKSENYDILEAKLTRQSLFSNNIDKVINQTKKANSDASKNKWVFDGKLAKRHVGLIFIVPYVSKRKYEIIKNEKLKERLYEYIDRIKKNIEPDIIAWSFPGPVEHKLKTRERMLLGVILIGNAFG